jgi:transposase
MLRILYNEAMGTKDKNTLSDQQLNQLSKEQLLSLCRVLQDKNNEYEKRLDFLTEQILLSQHRRFGASSEKISYAEDYEQASFFNEAEVEAAKASGLVPETDTIDIKSHKRKKQKGKRDLDLSKFPVVRIEHKLSEEEQFCSECHKALKVVTTETYKYLKYVPAHFETEEHLVSVYSCVDSSCGHMVRASKDPSLLRGSIATPSLVAAIMNAKYVNGIPLARQEAEFSRNGVELDRQKMAYWMIRCSEEYLSVIYDEMKKHLLQCQYNQADETRVQVLHEDGRKATTDSWMWVYRTSELANAPPIILFTYEQTRGSYHPKEFLSGYKGYLTTDAYKAYRSLSEDIIVTACMVHCRRYFHDALITIPEDKRKGTVAEEAIKRIAMLYQIETMLADKPAEQRYEERLKQSQPLLDAFFAWLKSMELASDAKSLIGKAIAYALNQQEYLKRYLMDGSIPIDNSATERAIRPFAQGRRAWLFCNTPNGAKASAVIYSIVETAKANGLHPYNYLSHLLEMMPSHMSSISRDFIKDLLPWSETLPDKCRVKKVELK